VELNLGGEAHTCRRAFYTFVSKMTSVSQQKLIRHFGLTKIYTLRNDLIGKAMVTKVSLDFLRGLDPVFDVFPVG